MILRKPYAFLIKNFKKIHIALLALSLYVAFQLTDVNTYIREYIRLGTYDYFGDPITNHINFWLNFAIFLLIVGSVALLLLLRYKKKPWKIYLVPIVEYIVMLFILSMIKSFFNGLATEIEATDIRLAKDLLMIFGFGQAAAIGIFVVRVFGLDIKKFQFNSDAEFLELSEEDREEFEIGLNFDKHSIIRGVKRLLRNIKYIYIEHKLVCWVIGGVLFSILAFTTGRYLVITKKTYSQGDLYSVGGFTFQVNEVYFTDKDYAGNVISKSSNFVIVDLTIKNHAAARTIYLENFHIKNGTSDFVTTKKTFAKEFQDFGVAYESTRKIKKDESLNLIIIYKVDKKLKKDRFVLFYQEKSGILRKIKLKVKDVSKVEEAGTLNIGDEMPLPFKNKEDVLRIDEVRIEDIARISVKQCSSLNCKFVRKDLNAPEGYKFLEIEFYTDVFEAKNIIDILKNYGKLNYRDSENEETIIDIENCTSEIYNGKVIYLKVPVELMTSTDITIDLTIRDKHYTYQLGEIGGLYEGKND